MTKAIYNISDIVRIENVGKCYRGDNGQLYRLTSSIPNNLKYIKLEHIKWNGETEPITDLFYIGHIFDLFFEEVSEEDVNNYINAMCFD